MYQWRKLTEKQRKELLALRCLLKHPWHSPPHRASGSGPYHLSAACYEHAPHIGYSPARLADFTERLLSQLKDGDVRCHAWCVLPNHYHLLVSAPDVKALLWDLGRLHGRTSFLWNGEDGKRGRKVWFNAEERTIRSDGHYWATINYIHQNPVRHRYAKKWTDWPYSSAADYLASVGREEALRIWREYPVLDYGKGWDDDGEREGSTLKGVLRTGD